MRNFLIAILFSALGMAASGQSGFQSISYQKALKKSENTGKLIFLQYESEKCDQCNDVANKAFNDNGLSLKLARDYIAIKVSASDPDRQQIANRYNLPVSSFATLYIDKGGRLVHRSQKTSSWPPYYTGEMKIADQKYLKLVELDADSLSYFVEGDKDIEIVKRIIRVKTDLGQETDLLLLEYMNLLPQDSVHSISTLQFIAAQAPVWNSKPDRIMRRSPIFDSAWYALPFNERAGINSRIISKSIQIAIAEKDENKAKAIAAFAGRTHQTSTGQKDAYDWNMMRYYLANKNYNQYLPVAADYYDRIFARATPSEIYRRDSARLANNLNSDEIFPDSRNARSDFSFQMRDAAERFYRLDKESTYIDRYLFWAKRSIDLYPGHANKHLYAQILYKAGKTDTAILEETEAIALMEKARLTGSVYEATYRQRYYTALEKMKKGEALTAAEY